MSAGEKNIPWWPLSVVFILAIIAPIAYVLILGYKEIKGTPEVILSPLLVLSVIALIMALAFTAAVFKYLDLADKNQSLGLPEGSIRAVIALSLILIFMISSGFIYYQVAHPKFEQSVRITEDMVNNFPNERIKSIKFAGKDGNETRYDVLLFEEKSETSEDIAKQIITTVGTLVVAVAGFYFGTKAVSVGAGIMSVSNPLIRSIDPKDGKQGDIIEGFKIFGKNFDLAESGEVKLVFDKNKIYCSDILSSPTEISCKISIPIDSIAGKWSVVVINADKGEDRLEGAFEIKPDP